MKTSSRSKKLNYTYTVGRRKTSVARVRLFAGKGESTVNEMPIAKYFPGDVSSERYLLPLRTVDKITKYYVSARVVGGGKRSQLDAVVLATARALSKVKKDEFRSPLKKLGLLTRDPRERERRKVGTGGKARRQKQSPKR